MAATVAIRAALQRLGFTNEAQTSIINTQDIDTIAELSILTDSEVESLCKVLRRPGGMVQVNGNEVPNPGTTVSLRAENNLKLACYYLRHRERTSRVLIITDVTLANVRAFREQRLSESKHENSDKRPTMDVKDWPKNMEALQEFLRAQRGETGIPLAYIVRDEANVGDDPVDGFPSVLDEMIARAPHVDGAGEFVPSYLTDRLKVWELIAEICRDLDCWTYVKSAQRTRNGRLAYQSLFNHYLGPNNVDNMANTSEKKLQVTTYAGEKKRWSFEKYVKLHVDQHAILNGLTDHGYSGIDDRSKVRHLMDGIKTKELDSVKTQILASANLRSDFDSCVTLYKDFLSQMKSTSVETELNVSSVTQVEGGKGVQDRYYTKEEYEALSAAQRDTLREKRKSRGHSKKEGGKKQKTEKQLSSFSKGLSKLTRQVSKMASAIKKKPAKDSAEKDSDGSDTGSDGDESPGGNRENPALTRQKKKKKK